MRRLLLGAALLLACARVPFVEPQPIPQADQGAWKVERERYTRAGKIYDGFATNAFASAVYQPIEVREARVDRVATWRKLTVQEKGALLATERDEAARWDDFLLALFTPDRADNDLDTARSVWRVALVLPEGDVLPEKIELVHVDATVRELYPNVGDFDVVYRVRFPRVSDAIAGRDFTLRLAGSRGRLDLRFAAGVAEHVPAQSGAGLNP